MATLETKSWVQQYVDGIEGEWFVVVEEYHQGQLRFTDYHGPCFEESIALRAKQEHAESFEVRANRITELVARSILRSN